MAMDSPMTTSPSMIVGIEPIRLCAFTPVAVAGRDQDPRRADFAGRGDQRLDILGCLADGVTEIGDLAGIAADPAGPLGHHGRPLPYRLAEFARPVVPMDPPAELVAGFL